MHQLEKIAKAKPSKLKMIVTSATVSKLITESRPWLLSGTCAFAHSSLLGMEEVGARWCHAISSWSSTDGDLHRLDAAALAFVYGSVPWYVYIKKPAVMKDIVSPLPK